MPRLDAKASNKSSPHKRLLVAISLAVAVLAVGALYAPRMLPSLAGLPMSRPNGFAMDSERGDGDQVYEIVPCANLKSAASNPNFTAAIRNAYLAAGFSDQYIDSHFKFRQVVSGETIILQICAGPGAVVTDYEYGSGIMGLDGFRPTSPVAHDYPSLISSSDALAKLTACAARYNLPFKGASTATFTLNFSDSRLEPYLTAETYQPQGADLTKVTDLFINLEDGTCSQTSSGAAS